MDVFMDVFYGVYKTTIHITGGHHPVETWSQDSTCFTRNISLGLLVHMLRAVLINCSFFWVPIPVLNVKNEFPAWSVCENLDSIFYAPDLRQPGNPSSFFVFYVFSDRNRRKIRKTKRIRTRTKIKRTKRIKRTHPRSFFVERSRTINPNICPMG